MYHPQHVTTIAITIAIAIAIAPVPKDGNRANYTYTGPNGTEPSENKSRICIENK